MFVIEKEMDKLNMKFDYANAYGVRENQIPVFLRCQGVRGVLEVENLSAKAIDKIKIILKGKSTCWNCEGIYTNKITGTLMNSLGHHGDCTLNWEPQRFVCESTVS
jgi:hypothetical protein